MPKSALCGLCGKDYPDGERVRVMTYRSRNHYLINRVTGSFHLKCWEKIRQAIIAIGGNPPSTDFPRDGYAGNY